MPDMKDFEEINALYSQFGYQCEEKGNSHAVFSLTESIYPGVDILVINEGDYEPLRSKYAEAGYSTKKILYKNVDTIDNDLYKKFFRPHIACKNMLEKYKEYTDRVLEPYQADSNNLLKYSYINVDYDHECDFKKEPFKNISIINSIENITLGSGPRLIIVEAAAGYGKTSTSQELIRVLCERNDGRRPFLMELERDRQAPTFHYLLVSQIEKNFGFRINSDIVIDNIRKGRIPLIIDGFDELLSKDIDMGREIIRSKKVETMLSTIATLLTDNSKIILTTRKTAIFSGEQFTDWFDYQRNICGRKFTVDRFQLHEARIEDWLEPSKQKLIPDALKNLSNPVLLSYLRYSNVLDNNVNITARGIIEKFFSSIYKREMTRQALPFKAMDQESILSNLSALFCVFDITADTRSNLKDAVYELNRGIIDSFCSNDDDEKAEVLNKLVNHALLDRHDSGLIGFLNDFIYGSLLAKAFLNRSKFLTELDGITIGNVLKVILASEFLDYEEKYDIANEIQKSKGISTDIVYELESKLLRVISSRYENRYCEGVNYKDVLICDKDGELVGCTFIQCKFDSCIFDWSKIKNSMFINCDFTNSTFDGNADTCEFYECVNAPESFDLQKTENIDAEAAKEKDLDKIILGKFFRAGSETSRIRHINGIVRDFEVTFTRKIILKHLTKLKSKGFIHIDGNNAWILQPGSDFLKKAE